MEPKIRLKGFSGEWKETTFDKSVTINSGMDYKHLAEGNIPVYGTGGYMLSVNESLSDVDAIGIGRKGTIDKPQLIKAPFWTVDTLFFMTPKNGNDLNFLYALSQKINWRKYDESTGVPSLSKLNIGKIEFAKPERNEQQAIASYFQHLNSLIQSTTKKIESLKQVKAASLQAMFPQEGETTPRVRFNGFEGEWETVSLSAILEERNEKSPKTSEFPLMAFIAYQGVAPKGERYDRSALINDAETKLYKKTEYGDFIYSSNNLETGSIGLNLYGKATISPVYSIFRCTNNVDYDFIGRRLVCRDIINEMIKWRQGVVYGQWRIHERDFLTINVLLPSYEEQKQIGKYFSSLDSQITLQTQRLEKLKQIKSACLDNMFV